MFPVPTTNNYNKVAPYYKIISRLVFGNTLIKAQANLFGFLPRKGGTLLIAGGGDGRILPYIPNKDSWQIDYVDLSEKMITLSKQKYSDGLNIQFFVADIFKYLAHTNNQYDAILTPFLFDNFEPDRTKELFGLFNKTLKVSGLWLLTDFDAQKTQKGGAHFLIKLMYLFFKIVANIETQQLTDITPYFKSNFSVKYQKHYYFDCINSVVYQKIESLEDGRK